jgi:hypothetical protein
MAYALSQSTPVLTGSQQTLVAHRQWLALTRAHVAFVSCRPGALGRPVGTVAAALRARWATLLSAAHLAQIRSDPPDALGRALWFADGARVVRIDFGRHVRRGPCTGTRCSAMLVVDPSLRRVLAASQAFNTFIAAHCPAA